MSLIECLKLWWSGELDSLADKIASLEADIKTLKYNLAVADSDRDKAERKIAEIRKVLQS